MIQPEKKFEELRQGLEKLDLSTSQIKIEACLRRAWKESHQKTEQQAPQKKWAWNIFNYALTASGVTALALITTSLTQPAQLPQSTVVQMRKIDQEKVMAEPVITGQSATLGTSGGFQPIEEEIYEDSDFTLNAEYGYEKDGQISQLLNESVILSIDVREDTLDVIHKLRDQVSVQHGYVLDISYHASYGTVDIKLPADQLNAFEDTLKELDINHEVEVTDYVVENISQKIVTLDEQIQNTQEEIEADKNKLNQTSLTVSEKQVIQEQIIQNEESITSLNQTRDEKIAQYDLISVRITINHYSSFWEGNYTQYDRSNLSGMVQYELSRAVYTVIRSGSEVLRFVIWVVLYSLIFIPAILITRKIIRKMIRKIKNL